VINTHIHLSFSLSLKVSECIPRASKYYLFMFKLNNKKTPKHIDVMWVF